ncbi:chitin deacetylase [Podila epicladia]|nr:chitin deacetylase [Podila epicladia]KAG0089033.1 chitin deacetylase [Podila epicladia]
MVKFFTFSIAALALSVALVSAQTPLTGYPPVNKVPDVNSPEVQAWLKEIDLTGAPTIPLHKGEPPACPNPPIPDECYWTCEGCAADDITACGAANTWGLTFDDGPSTDTPKLLDYLKTQKLSATFFLIGSNVIQYPDTVKREIAEGHHLASHTWSHHALTTLTNEQIVAEMKWTEKAVLAATGLRMKYMRPPYGDINNRVRFVLKKLGYIPVDWTGDAFDTNDWQMPTMTETQVIATFTKSLDAYAKGDKSKGFYCLEHDLNSMTVGVAQKLIPLGIARNISIASVAQCEHDAAPYQAGGTSPIPTISGATPTATTTAGTSTGTATGSATPSTTGNKSSGAGAVHTGALSVGVVIAAVALMA